MGFLSSLVVTTALAASLVGLVSPASARSEGYNLSPVVDGLCIKHTSHDGDLPCKIRVENDGDVIYVTDGYNTYTYVKGWVPNTYRTYVNDTEDSMKLCSYDEYNLNCFTSITFQPNEEV